MGKLKICFKDHFGGTFEESNLTLYESTWNDYGYHGLFELNFRKDLLINNPKIEFDNPLWLQICRIDGTMKKRLELCNMYNHDISSLPQEKYIAFPTKELCLTLLFNYPIEIRKEIVKSLCFNFGDDYKFQSFKTTNQYKVSVLRCITETDFLNQLQMCKEILFCELPLDDLLKDINLITK